MNFTREPIIETIISPKDGHKLLVRNSKGGNGEEYYVDAVEVVSFGHGCFFRSLERPKSFIVPVGDYEIVEVKEARVALKNVSHERSIKIGGGRDASLRQGPKEREFIVAKETESVEETAVSSGIAENAPDSAIGSRMDKRRDKRRQRRRRGGEDLDRSTKKGTDDSAPSSEPAEEGRSSEEPIADSFPIFTSLIPPPATLISETIGRYKERQNVEKIAEDCLSEDKDDEQNEEEKKDTDLNLENTEEKKRSEDDDEQSGNSESSSIHRVAATLESQKIEESSLSSTFFTSLRKDFFF